MSSFNRDTTGLEVVRAFLTSVANKTIVITGTTSGGLGSQTALDLAQGSPSHLILLARSASKVQPVLDQIKTINSSINAFFVPIELDKETSVTAAAKTINDKVDKVDLLINCAGIMATPYSTNEKGVESQMATNHVGHFLLTRDLMPKIKASGNGRVVNVSSDGYTISPVHFDDINFSGGETYDKWSGYGQSKTANVLFTQALSKRLEKVGGKATTCHPGVITSTGLGGHLDFNKEVHDLVNAAKKNGQGGFEVNKPKTVEQGTSTILAAALDPEIEGGTMLMDCQPHQIREYARADANAERLWKWSEEITGAKFKI